MTDKELAKRMAASPKWEWREEMLVHGHPVDGTIRVMDYDEQKDFVDSEYPDLADPATAGIVLNMCEDMARGRGQTFVVVCGIWSWQADVFGPEQGKRAHVIHKDEPWNNPYSLGAVAGRLFLYLAEPLPEVTRGKVNVFTDHTCSECRASIDRIDLTVAQSSKRPGPIECKHCGALLEVE